jgi:hypothetical protein
VGTLAVRDNSIVAFATTYATESEIRACADRINALAASGRLSAHVARTLPLSKAQWAHELIEDKDVRCWELLARPMFGAMPTLSLPSSPTPRHAGSAQSHQCRSDRAGR